MRARIGTPDGARLWQAFRGDIAAIEFAIIAPNLIVSLISTTDIFDALLVQRRVSDAASTIGDLVSQATSVAKGHAAPPRRRAEMGTSPSSAGYCAALRWTNYWNSSTC